MLSSVAERVYWLGRYLERVENTARLVNVFSAMLLDLPRGTHIDWGILVDITGCNEDYAEAHETLEERPVVRFLLADAKSTASVINGVNMMRENARTSREIIAAEAWEQINNLYHRLRESLKGNISRRARQQILDGVIGDCQRIFGLLAGSMSHNDAYSFIQIGRKLERADMTSRMVDVGSISLFPSFAENPKTRQQLLQPFENIVWMNVLRCLSAYQAYRQTMRNRVVGEDVVRFLLKDDEFPRSIGYCLGTLDGYLKKLPNNKAVILAVDRAKKVINTRITRGNISRLLEDGLLEFIDELQVSIADIHDTVSETWFSPVDFSENLAS